MRSNPFYSDATLSKVGVISARPKVRKKNQVRKSADYPFIGIDGEGAGTDDIGRQNYMLLSAAGENFSSELYTGSPLSTDACLDFILKLPAKAIIVGFSFGYDITMILRNLSSDRRARLLKPLDPASNYFEWTFYNIFGLQYLPKQHLKVCRTFKDREGKLHPVKGSTRTIYEVFGFFQSSFLKTLKNYEVTDPETLAMIEKNKNERGFFDENITQEVRDYCLTECRLLVAVMNKLRDACNHCDIKPRTWNGAGKLAKALHKSHETPRREHILSIPTEVWEAAGKAYYGGRFEVTLIGAVPGPVYEYDINSAYPAAMLDLPCMSHGRWKPVTRRPAPGRGTHYIGEIVFTADQSTIDRQGGKFMLGGFPIRSKNGGISWPAQGRGIYWGVEIEGAEKLGVKVKWKGGHVYERNCDCHPFAWVEELYEYRKTLGKSTQGYPLKLGINSLYGTLAQRIGRPIYGNYVWAGLITATTRAKLMDAAARDVGGVVMMATDGIYTTRPLDLPVGPSLGQWEAAEHERMFVVQPGLYWGPPKPKTRGVPLKFFEHQTAEFEAAWSRFMDEMTSAHPPLIPTPPEVPIEMTSFVGLKLAQARGTPETAGRWVTAPRTISFNWKRKRRLDRAVYENDHATTIPLPGTPDLCSVYYKSVDPDVIAMLDASMMDLEDQPDYIDLSTPWKD